MSSDAMTREQQLGAVRTTKALRAECFRLDAVIEDLNSEPSAFEPPADADPFDGAPILAVHISGAPWNGTHVRLVRCATGGEAADRWMIYAGSRMLTTSGQWLANARPYHQIRRQLQPKVAFDLSTAIARARKVRVSR